MMCEWTAYLNLLPHWMREDVDRIGANSLQELRLRIGYPAELILSNGRTNLNQPIMEKDLNFVINIASQYSPWVTHTLRHGYITAAGGHRIGVCGEVVMEKGIATGIRSVSMLCLRVAREYRGISDGINASDKSVLIIGRPGCGKTTLLRDLIYRHSSDEEQCIGVVDERCELFPRANNKHCFEPGNNTDILSGVNKRQGINMLLRCMNPAIIAVDEITSADDCEALIAAGWCGVKLFATAHAGSRNELYRRQVYKTLLDTGLFDRLVVMHPDKTWHLEELRTGCYA